MPEATDGYQVGNAFIQMLPSFRLFHKKIAAEMAGVGDVKVAVEPQVSSAKLAAVATAMDQRLSKMPITKRIDIDERALAAKMAALNAKRDALTLKIDADISALKAKVANWERTRGTTKIDVDAEIAKAQAKIKALEAQRDAVHIQVDVDIDKAEQNIRRVERELNRVANNQFDLNMEAGDASRAVAIIGLLTAGLSVVGQLAPAAAAAIAAIPAALAGAAQGIAAVVAGMSGISDTVKALQAVEDEQASKSVDSARQRVGATNRVASAQSSLERALEQADRSAIDGAHQVRAARDALADAQVNGTRRVQDAERSLTTAQQSALDAQEALTRARKDATENLEDLRLALSGAALDEESAVLAVERAQARLNAARAAGTSGLDMAEIELGARQAEQALAEVRDRYGDLQEEAGEANRAGVDGNRQVVAAQRDAQDATQRVRDAERDLADTRTDAARDVAKAQERVADAQQQASQAAVDASRAVADAQRSLAEASVTAGDTSSAAMDKLALSMSKLSPAGQVFAQFLQNRVKPAIQDVAAATQGTMLPRLQVAMDTLLTFAPMVRKAFAEAGEVIGDLAIKGADMVTSGPWRADFASIMARNNRVLGMMGNAGLSALDVVRNLTIAAGPLVEALAASTEGYLAQFAAWIQGKRDSGELATWFQEMSVRIREAFATFAELAGGAFNLLQALAPLGHAILDIVGPFVQWLGAMAEANPALTAMIALGVLGTSTFISFFRTVGGLTQAFKTSSGVYQKLKGSILGVQVATDRATAATARNEVANQSAAATAGRTGGLVGKLSNGLDSVRGAYDRGSQAGERFATRATAAVGQLGPAAGKAVDAVDRLATATGRGLSQAAGAADTALSRTSTVLHTGFIRASLAAESAVQGLAAGAASATAAVERGMIRARLGVEGAREALSAGLVPAALALDQTVTGAQVGLGRFGATLEDKVIRGANVARDAASRLGTTIQTGVVRATLAANDALDTFGNRVRNSVLRPLTDARTAYTNTSTAVRTNQLAQSSLNATLGTTPTVLGRVREGLSGITAMAAGSGASLRSLGATAAGPVVAGLTTLGTTAQRTISGVSAVVSGTVAAVGRGVGGVVSGLVGALGGPFGLAITAATVGLGFLVSAQADAAAAAAEHKAQIQTLTDALIESNGIIDENVRKQIGMDLQTRSIADNARDFGLNVGNMVDAIANGGDAASNFEDDLRGVGEEIIRSNHLGPRLAGGIRTLTEELLKNGGSARDNAPYIEYLADAWQKSTGASDGARDAYKAQLDQYADLVGGYRNSKGDFKNATQDQKDIAAAQDDAKSATERHTQALKKLQDQILGQIDKNLAYRQAQQSLTEATDRVAQATGDEMPAALLQQEQALLDVIQKSGDLAYAQSTAADETGKLRDQQLKQIQTAVELAGTFSGPLPESLQTYLSQLITTKDETGNYIFLLDQIPPDILTKVIFDGKDARQGIIDLTTFMANQTAVAISGFATNIARGLSGKALGGIDVPAYAKGGVRPMSGKVAQIVPPNQPRLIGDRMRDPEGFIPINTEPRSIGILTQVAAMMGFGLVPLALGAVLGMADGGVNAAGTPAATAGADAALTVSTPPVDALTAAVQTLIAAGLAPLATEVTTATAPALALLEDHAGVRAVASVTALAGLLPPLRDSFAVTAAAISAAWLASTQASQGSVTAIGGYLATLRYGIQQTGTVFGSTADWIGTTWARIRQYTADPVRAALAGPYNAGLIPAWNYLNTFFALNRPLAPIGIPFAVGGEVPGVGSGDIIPALLTPGEYVISKPVVKKWGLRNLDAAHMAARRGGFPGLEGMLADDGKGIFRVGYASGGPVPEALARATQFGRSMHGKPYIWGGSSEAGTDCSGWMAMLARALVDEKPYARREWATASTAGGNPPPRFARGIEGLMAIGVNPGVHTAGTLAGTNVESGGAHNYVAFGPPSTGADDSQFPLKFHLPELGGKFVSGGAGGAFNLSSFIRDSFNATYEQLGRYQEAWGANMLAQAGASLVSQAADAIVNQAINTIVPVGTTGNVESWRPLVLQALRMLGLPLDWADITLRRMNQESGGNQFAVNNWDSNAKRGDPSQGLMQVIPSTFRAYRDTRAPNNILDPLANILASAKYAMSRYGSLPAAYGRAGGYDGGGYLPPGYTSVYNGLSRPEAVLTGNQWSAMYTLAAQAGSGGDFRGNLYLSSGEFLGAVEGVIERANTESGQVLARRIR